MAAAVGAAPSTASAMETTGLYDQPLDDAASAAWAVGRKDALVLERYLSRSLQSLHQKGLDSEPIDVLRDIQSLLSFCMSEYGMQTAARCNTRGRLLRKLADGYERLFAHTIDLLTEQRESADEAAQSFQADYNEEMEMVRAKVMEERSMAAADKERLGVQAEDLEASLAKSRQELEAARAKTSSLQMECDLYRQECDKAWAINATLQKRCSTAEAEANAQALALAAAAQTGDASPATSGGGIVGATDQQLDGSGAEAWFMQEPVDDELERVRGEKAALESRLEAVTAAVLAGGGIDALQSALSRSSTAATSAAGSPRSQPEPSRRKSRGSHGGVGAGLGSEESAGVWRAERSSSPDTPGRLVAGGAKERSSVTMGFSPESGTLEETYYQQLRQGPRNQPRSRGLASSEERRPRVSSGA